MSALLLEPRSFPAPERSGPGSPAGTGPGPGRLSGVQFLHGSSSPLRGGSAKKSAPQLRRAPLNVTVSDSLVQAESLVELCDPAAGVHQLLLAGEEVHPFLKHIPPRSFHRNSNCQYSTADFKLQVFSSI